MTEKSAFTDLQYIPPTQPTPILPSTQQSLSNLTELQVGAGNTSYKVNQSGWWMGADKFSDGVSKCDMLGNAVFNSILINGRDGQVLANAINANGNFINQVINAKLDTQSQQILGAFTFGASGAITINTDANNGLWLSPIGILGKKAGVNTFALDNGGNLALKGDLTGSTGTFGNVTITGGSIAWGIVGGTGRPADNATVGATFGTNVYGGGSGYNQVGNNGYLTYITGDSIVTGTLYANLCNVVNINADNINAGTITGRTLRTVAPASGTGQSVVITGGNNQNINFYYDATIRGYIGGYTTEGSEVTYVQIVADSGRYIKLKNSFISINGNLNPSSGDTYTLGTSGEKWKEGWFQDLVVSHGYTGDIYVATSNGGSPTKKLNIENGIVYDR